MRVLAALLVGLAIGFGAGYVAFGSPFGSSQIDRIEAADRLTAHLRTTGADATSADCRQVHPLSLIHISEPTRPY